MKFELEKIKKRRLNKPPFLIVKKYFLNRSCFVFNHFIQRFNAAEY